MLERRRERRVDEVELTPVIDRETVLALQRAIEEVHVAESIGLYMVDVVSATRASTRVQVGASPRGSLALLKLSRGLAALRGRDFVTPEDVKNVAVPALAHRLTLNPELWVQRIRAEDVVQECLDAVPTPKAEDAVRARRDPRRDSEARGLRVAGRARALRRHCVPGARSSSCSPRRSCSCWRSGSSSASEPEFDVEVRSDRARVLEGDDVATPDRARCDDQDRAAGARRWRCRATPFAEGDTSFGLTLAEGERRELTTSLRFPRWGVYRLGRAGPGGLRPARISSSSSASSLPAHLLRVYPREERLREIVRPRDTQAYVGNLVARQKGEGIEFADLRLYQPGDRVRRVNWKATARRGALVVNEEHPERNVGGRAAARLVRRGAARRGRARSTRRYARRPRSPARTCAAATRWGC